MNNVTEINATNEINETLARINRCLPKSHKPDVELINIDGGYFLGEISKKYDLPKFIRSLTDEELTWKREVRITGLTQSCFTHTPPEDIWDDEDALEEYMDNLYPDDMEQEMEEFIDKDLKISYQLNVVVSPETVAKLEDAKFQMRKYQVEGVFA
tara:strand:+ start:89 stop:553 length:465 start_codon:yes stop_codon:yes gene_type:complete